MLVVSGFSRLSDGAKVREDVRILIPKNSVPKTGYVGIFLDGKFLEAVVPNLSGRYYEYMLDTKAKGISEVWCVSVNDAFVMGAWARDQKAGGKVRMMADGSAEFTKKLGLELDLTARGLGLRMQRFSMVLDNGVVSQLNIEAAGKFEVSSAEAMLAKL